MKVTHVTIQNVLGIESLEFSPGAVTILEGANATGKTSVIEAIKAAVGGGKDATLVRNGTKAAQVVLLLDDETSITRRQTSTDGGTTVKHPKFGVISKPQSFLAERIDPLAVNPVAFLTAPPAKRAEYLLEVLPIEVTDKDLQKAGVASLPPAMKNGLDRIETARKAVYDQRTGVNRACKEKKATVSQLREGLPPIGQEAEDPKAIRVQKEVLEKERDTKRIQAETANKAVVDADDVAARKQIDQIRAEAQRAIDTITANLQKRTRENEERLRGELAGLTTEYAPRLEELAGQVAAAEEKAKQAVQQAQTRKLAERMELEAAGLEEESGTLSGTLEQLEALKTSALENLPIKDVEVRDGQIWVGGVAFDRLNKARQVQLALNIARLRAGEIPLVLVDGLECLDAETFTAFEKVAAKSGLQLICNRVTSGPLTVRTIEAVA